MSRKAIHGDEKLAWFQWAPGLDHGHRKLGDVMGTMPSAAANEIPWLIRLLENPSSPLALPGAITLARHDAIHVLLGRGLRAQDEAFVIGFTMGADPRLTRWQEVLFEFCANRLYPRVYRFSESDLITFRLGVGAGRGSNAKMLQDFPFEDHMDKTVDEVRTLVGISRPRIRAFHQTERIMNADGRSTDRLDADPDLDVTDIRPPDGEASGWKKERQ